MGTADGDSSLSIKTQQENQQPLTHSTVNHSVMIM